jgi:CHAT domain-containing protein
VEILGATEADLREYSAGAQIISIFAHAELDRFAPMFSAIHLGAGGQYDGRLEVREIYELDLTQGTELVILSGSETGSDGTGEDFALLNRAFLEVGADRVVASLWSVDDAATSELLTAFVAQRQNWDNDAEALRAAMLATRNNNPDPYFWASFVLTGLPS